MLARILAQSFEHGFVRAVAHTAHKLLLVEV
jgi:hypothetical protein